MKPRSNMILQQFSGIQLLLLDIYRNLKHSEDVAHELDRRALHETSNQDQSEPVSSNLSRRMPILTVS